MAAESDVDPVKEILMDLKRGKSSKKVDGRKLDAAMNFHNKMMAELNELRPAKTGEESKPQTEFEKCQQENVILKRELIETRNKLNAIAREKRENSTAADTDNVKISEVSDPFRPSLLAEEFRSFYDNDWKKVYDDLDKLKLGEQQVIGILVSVIKGIEELCAAVMKQHLAKIEQVALDDLKLVKVHLPGKKDGALIADSETAASKEETERSQRLIREYMRSLGHLSIAGLLQLFQTHYLEPIITENSLNGNINNLDKFINKLINNIWKMKMADPPLAFVWQETGEPFSRHLSTFYKKTGNQVVQPVWPTVLSRQGGPILYKGIVIAE